MTTPRDTFFSSFALAYSALDLHDAHGIVRTVRIDRWGAVSISVPWAWFRATFDDEPGKPDGEGWQYVRHVEAGVRWTAAREVE